VGPLSAGHLPAQVEPFATPVKRVPASTPGRCEPYRCSPWQTPGVTDEADLEEVLLAYVLNAHLPPDEPIMRWWRWAESNPTTARPRSEQLRVRAHDHALLVGECEYHVDRRTGWVEVRDYSDHPRAMRSQVYQPDRPASRTCLQPGRT